MNNRKMIYLDDAIDAFKKELTVGESKGNYVTICSAVGYEGAKQILERLPSVQPEITKRTAETEQNIPNGELISRKAAIDAMRQYAHYDDFDVSVVEEDIAIIALKDLPSVQERLKGRWLVKHDEIFADMHFCSRCGELANADLYGEEILSAYCPNCGAHMTEGEKDETD